MKRNAARRGPIETIESKGIKIPLYDAGSGKVLLSFYAEGKRKLVKCRNLEAAREEARAKIAELTKGIAHVGAAFTLRQTAAIADATEILRAINVPLSQAVREYAEGYKILGRQPLVLKACQHYRDFIEEQKRKAELIPIKLPALVEKFMEDIRERKKSRRYTLDMQARLAKAAQFFNGFVADIKADDVDLWLASMKGVSGRTKNNYRAALGTLLAFARKKKHLPRGQAIEVEFSTRYDSRGERAIGVYSPQQLATLLTNIERRFVPHVALAGFAGLRSAEIVRLEWPEVRFEQGVIEVKASKAKTASRRLAPLLPVCAAWLLPLRKNSGPVLEGIHDEFALATYFKRAVDAIADGQGKPLVRIIHNGLRHSYITYRMATEKSAAAVALEAGNSPRMIFEHYRELATEAVGRQWFNVLPIADEKILSLPAA